LVIGIVDAEIACIAQPIRMNTQSSRAEGVKGGQLWITASAIREHLSNPPPHFIGSLVGKGDGYNVIGPDNIFTDKMNDAVSDDARFTASGACKYQ
jgi:hypothetical protein